MLQLRENNPSGPRALTSYLFRSFWVTRKGSVVIVQTFVPAEGTVSTQFQVLNQDEQSSSIDPDFAYGPGLGYEL